MTSPQDLAAVIQDLGIDVPVYRAETIGDDTVIYLYGGRVIHAPATPPAVPTPAADVPPSSAGAGPTQPAPAREEPAVAGLPTEPPPTSRPRRKAKP